jgi:hypothetical protein
MTKGFRTVLTIRGKEPMLRKVICEVRYADGHLYLDHCGRLLKSLVGEDPAWVVSPDPTPQGSSALNFRTGMQLGLSIHACSLTLDKTAADEVIDEDEVGTFAERTGAIFETVLDEFEVTQFSRLGYRETYYFPFENKEDSEQWLRDLGIFTVAPGLYDAFAARPDVASLAVVIEGEECRYRITLNGIEQAAQMPIGESVINVRARDLHEKQKKAFLESMKRKRQRQISSAFAVVLDIDTFLLDPPSVYIKEFVKRYSAENLQRFRAAVSPEERQGKGK